MYSISTYDYYLPPELIAQEPLLPRDMSRMMVIKGDEIVHTTFRDLPRFMNKGDIIIFNDSKVIPAKIICKRKTGGKVELLIIRQKNDVECVVRGKKLMKGEILKCGKYKIEVVEWLGGWRYLMSVENIKKIMDECGKIPIPPYIKGKFDDKYYQTIYASKEGSIAAPTAGLHFTHNLIDRIRKKGVKIAFITLHVGIGTFKPVRVDDIREHNMEYEYIRIEEKEAEKINETVCSGGRIFAVGTTVTKALESMYSDDERIEYGEKWSDLFIHPPYKFKSPIYGLITNFHLPKSTLVMLVAAFMGIEKMKKTYSEAIRKKYRFYSLGDGMLCTK